MKRILAACMLILVGCATDPSAILSATVAPTRAEATTVCQNAGVSDTEIDVLFLAVTISRDAGVAVDENADAATSSCGDDANCLTCRLTVIAAVYGE